MKLTVLAFLSSMVGLVAADKVETLRLEPGPNMSRAELNYVATVPNPVAVLVLCPGCNGSAEDSIRSPAWIAFAKKHHLGLVGLSFVSPMPAIEDGTGYYYASLGSGEKLLEGIRKIYRHSLPLLLYGISGGAHFTSRFEEWKPESVLSWCAYSAGWWDQPHHVSVSRPGIVACGEEDPRYGASLAYFKQGRAAGKPWLWVSLGKTGHNGSADLDDFVRNYFATALSRSKLNPLWIDIDSEVKVTDSEQRSQPSLTAWLPSDELYESWKRINEP